MVVHDHDLLRAGLLRPAHGGIDLFGIELPAFLVQRLAGIRLGASDNAGDAFHVADDVDSHASSFPVDTGLRGKRVLVTGASGGIGSACVRAFLDEGAEVVAHYHQGRDRAEALGDVQLVQADLTREDEVGLLFDEPARSTSVPQSPGPGRGRTCPSGSCRSSGGRRRSAQT